MKGVVPRLLWVPPKVALVMAFAEWLAKEYDKMLRKECVRINNDRQDVELKRLGR
jgi:hypothetical protein